jgi:hypothetical protein
MDAHTLTVMGIVIQTIGSILLGWAVIHPGIWITKHKRLDANIEALLNAADYAEKKVPEDPKAAADLATSVVRFYGEDLRQRAAQKIGWWAIGMLVIGLAFQLLALGARC